MDKVHRFNSASEIEAQAADWLARLDGDHAPDEQTRAALQAWLCRSPAHREALYRMAAFWQSANLLTALSIPLYHQHATEERGSFLFTWRPVLAMALVLVVGATMLLGSEMWLAPGMSGVSGNGIYETRVGEQNAITLLDGSTIALNTNSRVQVNYTRHKRAIALMRGEAHFEVSKDPGRPFEVNVGGGVVKAIGTAFSVHYSGDTVEVLVTEGAVSLAARRGVAANGTTNGLASEDLLGELGEGQSVTFEPRLAQSIEGSIRTWQGQALKQKLAWRDGLMLFSGQPLSEVVKEMNRYSTLTIKIVDPSIETLSVGGQFRVDETEAMLKNLSLSLNINAHRKNNNMVLLSKKDEK